MDNSLTESKSEAMKRTATFRALASRNYKLYFSGQLVSLSGTWMQNIAQSWLVYRLTGSAILLGFVGFASQIPVFLLATVGGTFADHHNRHHIVITTQTISMALAFVLAALTLTHTVQVWHVFVLASTLGVVNAFDIPTRQAFIPQLVDKEHLINAIALNSTMFNGARIVGPAIAGVLVAAIGEGWCFFANGVSFLAVIGGLLMMQLPPHMPKSSRSSMIANMTGGLKYVRRTYPVFAVVMLLAVTSFVAMPYTVLMPIFADQILHGGASGLGVLMGATGLGAMCGALVLASKQNLRGLGSWVAIASAGFGVSLILFSLSRSFWLSAALLAPVGFCMMIQMASSNTLIQSMVPDALRGRVMAVYAMVFMGMAPFGALFAGTLADRIGSPLTVALGGAACIGGAILFASKLTLFRAEAREVIGGLREAAKAAEATEATKAASSY